MVINPSIKANAVTAFQPSNHLRIGWSQVSNKATVIEHRGYVSDAETHAEAIEGLYEMIMPLNRLLSQKMIQEICK